MCVLCLQDFEFYFDPPAETLEQKKKRLLHVKSLLNIASQLTVDDDVCDSKVEALKEEQYRLSREF